MMTSSIALFRRTRRCVIHVRPSFNTNTHQSNLLHYRHRRLVSSTTPRGKKHNNNNKNTNQSPPPQAPPPPPQAPPTRKWWEPPARDDSWIRRMWGLVSRRYRMSESVYNAADKLLDTLRLHSRRVEFYDHCRVPRNFVSSFGVLAFHVWVSSIPLRLNGKPGQDVMDALLWELFQKLQKELEGMGEHSFLIGKRASQYQELMYGNFQAYDTAVRSFENDDWRPFIGVIWRNVYRADMQVSMPHLLWFADYALETFHKMMNEENPEAMLLGRLELLEPPATGPEKHMNELKKSIRSLNMDLNDFKKPLTQAENLNTQLMKTADDDDK